MVCEKCHKEKATVHLTEIVNNEKHEAHLCEECARSSGVGFKITFSIHDILGNLMEGKGPKGKRGGAGIRCPECGIGYPEFKAKARMGCSNDYELFKAGLVPLLEKIHGSSQHVGKVPRTEESQVQKENELMRLRRQLDTLIKSEKYEAAAEIRDQIRTLETELGISA